MPRPNRSITVEERTLSSSLSGHSSPNHSGEMSTLIDLSPTSSSTKTDLIEEGWPLSRPSADAIRGDDDGGDGAGGMEDWLGHENDVIGHLAREQSSFSRNIKICVHMIHMLFCGCVWGLLGLMVADVQRSQGWPHFYRAGALIGFFFIGDTLARMAECVFMSSLGAPPIASSIPAWVARRVPVALGLVQVVHVCWFAFTLFALPRWMGLWVPGMCLLVLGSLNGGTSSLCTRVWRWSLPTHHVDDGACTPARWITFHTAFAVAAVGACATCLLSVLIGIALDTWHPSIPSSIGSISAVCVTGWIACVVCAPLSLIASAFPMATRSNAIEGEECTWRKTPTHARVARVHHASTGGPTGVHVLAVPVMGAIGAGVFAGILHWGPMYMEHEGLSVRASAGLASLHWAGVAMGAGLGIPVGRVVGHHALVVFGADVSFLCAALGVFFPGVLSAPALLPLGAAMGLGALVPAIQDIGAHTLHRVHRMCNPLVRMVFVVVRGVGPIAWAGGLGIPLSLIDGTQRWHVWWIGTCVLCACVGFIGIALACTTYIPKSFCWRRGRATRVSLEGLVGGERYRDGGFDGDEGHDLSVLLYDSDEEFDMAAGSDL